MTEPQGIHTREITSDTGDPAKRSSWGTIARRMLLTGALALVAATIAFVSSSIPQAPNYAVPSAEATHCPQYVNEAGLLATTDTCRALFIVDPGIGQRIPRSAFYGNNLFSFYTGKGVHPNFLWYAKIQPMSVPYNSNTGLYAWGGCNSGFNPATGNASAGVYSKCTGDIGFPYMNANVSNSVFNPPGTPSVTVQVLRWGNTFISDVCGNYSVSIFRNQDQYPVPTISGFKFNDLDGDGVKDPGEPGVSGIAIRLRRTSSQVGQSAKIVDTTTTNASGYYEFKLVGDGPGTYRPEEVLPSGYVQTLAPGSINVGFSVEARVYPNNNFLNFRKGAINGQKFEDMDGDGVKDGGEPGIEGWEIFLTGTDGLGNSVNRSDNTDSNGNYEFTGVSPGTYKVSEAPEPKTPNPGDQWVQSFPASGQYNFSLTSGQTISSRDFGNYELGSISGRKYHDLDGNGEEDGTDVGLQDWQINLTGTAGDGSPMNRSTTTDANGDYIFDKVAPGDYKVSEKLPGHPWIQTQPNPKVDPDNYTLVLQSRDDIEDRDFGNTKLGSIHGLKFQDIGGDGVRDIGDIPLEGWTINLNGKTGLGNQVSRSTTTNADGEYWFMDVAPGQYTVSEKLEPFWVQTVPPPPGTYKVPLRSGDEVRDLDFGNFASFGKSPQHSNLILTRQGDKIPPASCLEGNDSVTVAVVIAPIPDLPDPKDPSQSQELGAFEFDVNYNHKDVCLELVPATAAADMICTVEDSVTKPALEGVARIGCVTLGKESFPDTDTPEGRHLVDIIVRPQPDVYSLAKPNQDNGIVVQLKNKNCDFSDLQGHPIPSIKCANSSVTIRYLEGDVEPDCVVDAADIQAVAFRWGVEKGSLIYSDFMNLEPASQQADDDIDINDLQFVYGRFGSTCAEPHPPQDPVNPLAGAAEITGGSASGQDLTFLAGNAGDSPTAPGRARAMDGYLTLIREEANIDRRMTWPTAA